MKRILLLSFVLLGLITSAWAQRTVSGKVTADGEGLPGVAVRIKGTSQGTVTDMDGNYRLEVPGNNTVITFTFIGYADKEVTVGNRSVVDVVLSEDVETLSEVVVTAVGIEREQKALGYSVGSVSGEAISESRSTNVVNALSGKVAGVQVTSSGGGVGQGARVTLRGARSLTGNNEPLFVVDGIIISNANDGNSASTNVTGVAQPNRAADINPEDIESISVLKGPAAAALYGIRAANGAIIITTKTGRGAAKRGELDIDFTSTYMVDEPLRLPDYQNTYAQGSQDFVYSNGTSRSFGPRIEGQMHTNVLGQEVPMRVYDPRSQFLQTGSTAINNLSFAGGDEKSNFYLSLGAQNQESYLPGNYFDRYTARINAERRTERFTAGINLNYIHSGGNTPFLGQSGSNPIFSLFHTPVSYDLAGYGYQREDGSQINFRGGSFDNPFWSANNTYYKNANDRVIGAVNLGYSFNDNLRLDYRLNTDVMNEESKSFYEVGTGGWQNGRIAYDDLRRQEINSDLILGYDNNFGGDVFSFNGLLGWNVNQRTYSYEGIAGTNFVVPGFENIDNTSSKEVPVETDERRRLMGVYGQVDLGYKNYLFLTLTGRNDWSSTLPVEERSFFYPSASLAFAFTDAFDFGGSAFNFGKLRLSAARTGNDAAPYSLSPLFSAAAFSDGFTDGIAFPVNGVPGYSANDILGNPNIKPETVTNYEAGVDLRFLDSRVTLDATYFYTKSTDLIFPVDITPTTGYTNYLANAGQLDSKGLEVALGLNPIRTSDFRWDVSLVWSRIRTEVVEIIEGVDQIYLGGFSGDPSIQAQVGQRYGIIRGTSYQRDPNGNILVDSDPTSTTYGFPLIGGTESLGHVEPDWTGGLRNSLNFKGIELDFLFDFRKGGYIWSGTSELLQFYGVAAVTEDRENPVIIDGVKNVGGSENPNYVPNDIAIFRRANYWDQVSNITEANVYENNWLKLRELNLSYSLPSSLFANRFGFVRGVKISLTGRNLALWTNVPDIDPEGSAFGTGNGQGASRFDLPSSRSVGGSIRVQF
ncbi:SusC/RagA family TonB-linked outer membrane protein [Cesiribacter sp. SM1]|uniref:SusC/RagA family TonB-linked outer membrane protein n=1 Tax=Cesiribacter sp. SM1 TaxID=2861196 RepID=UPI001CD37EDE|nr:SusC/RagA family TonB-linked outer membrane protein [Cesiribacter sp. SM1]